MPNVFAARKSMAVSRRTYHFGLIKQVLSQSSSRFPSCSCRKWFSIFSRQFQTRFFRVSRPSACVFSQTVGCTLLCTLFLCFFLPIFTPLLPSTPILFLKIFRKAAPSCRAFARASRRRSILQKC